MSLQSRPADRVATNPDRCEKPPPAVDFAQDLAHLARLGQADYLA